MMNERLITSYAISLGCLVAAAACSGDDEGTETTNTTAAMPGPSAPSTDTPMQGESMLGEPPQAEAPAESAEPGSESSTESPPTGVQLEEPAVDPSPESGPSGEQEEMAEAPIEPGEVEAGAPVPSAGCGSTAAVESGRFSIDVGGNEREYILALPDDYDSTRPYRLVFTWHPGGGTAQGTANNYYGLRQLSEDSAIFVSPEGINNGWANTQGRDIAFLDAMLERFEGELCIDESRLFSTGFSYGGMMSFAVGCARAEQFRAIAPMSGALYSGCEDGDVSIAMFGFHGNDDDVVPLGNGETARNVIAERNGCEPVAAAVEAEDGCLSFQGCAEGAPTTWCEFDGGHRPAPNSASRIWEFFSGF